MSFTMNNRSTFQLFNIALYLILEIPDQLGRVERVDGQFGDGFGSLRLINSLTRDIRSGILSIKSTYPLRI